MAQLEATEPLSSSEHAPRKLRNIVVDSRRWNDFQFRDDDIVIATWSKSGTTWTQQIVAQLIFDADQTVYGQALSPWIDGFPFSDVLQAAEAQTHRRFLKTHLPADALRMSDKAKYIYVGRDARDVFWSWHHHHMSFSDAFLSHMNSLPDRDGGPMPFPDPDIRASYLHWLAADDVPCGSFWAHVQSWWDIRERPHVLLLHYANLKADTAAAVRQIASFLEIDLDEAKLPAILDHCSLDHMRKLADEWDVLTHVFKDGASSFINQGTNGRWREVLSEEEIARCDQVAAAKLTPDCAHWLTTGEYPA
jgi:aryl sulfotransferase